MNLLFTHAQTQLRVSEIYQLEHIIDEYKELGYQS